MVTSICWDMKRMHDENIPFTLMSSAFWPLYLSQPWPLLAI